MRESSHAIISFALQLPKSMLEFIINQAEMPYVQGGKWVIYANWTKLFLEFQIHSTGSYTDFNVPNSARFKFIMDGRSTKNFKFILSACELK